jgi:hypothetical protein
MADTSGCLNTHLDDQQSCALRVEGKLVRKASSGRFDEQVWWGEPVTVLRRLHDKHFENFERSPYGLLRLRSIGGKGSYSQKRASQRRVKASQFRVTRLPPPIRARVQTLLIARRGNEQVFNDPWGCPTKPNSVRLVLGSSPALPRNEGSNRSATTEIAPATRSLKNSETRISRAVSVLSQNRTGKA